MAEVRSPLQEVARPGEYGAIDPSGAKLILSQQTLTSLWQIAGWGDFAQAAESTLDELGLSGLGDYRAVRSSSAVQCYRIAPDKMWLRDCDTEFLTTAITKAPAGRLTSLDLSHSRVVIGISGVGSSELLAKLMSIDLSLSSFPADSFAQTGIHHVAVMIHRLAEDQFELLVPVTWAVSVWDWTCLHAEPMGYRVEAP
ncbi:MAG: hypothetical protein AAF414_00540 [Pseudomonadota bacterium]